MARRRKIRKIQEAMTFSNVFQPDSAKAAPGKPDSANQWRDYFHNNNPATLELGCGTGAYALALARMFPKRNFIGIDIKGARLWTGAKTALAEGLNNVAFLRVPIETLSDYFNFGEVTDIWITFPDPFPRKKQAKHRLTSPRFLRIYRSLLKPAGIIHFKTDDEALFDYTVETVERESGKIIMAVKNLYVSPVAADGIIGIQTKYEERHRTAGKEIHYLEFCWQ